MKILFVSGTSVGGAARSTYELCELLAAQGHDIETIMTTDEATQTIARYKRVLNASVKIAESRWLRFLAPVADRLRSRVGIKRESVEASTFRADRCAIPENLVVPRLLADPPDVVVVNSVERPAWRHIRATCIERKIPTVFYVRESSGVRHFTNPPALPDLLLANAEAHADEARALGLECHVVPSVVDTQRCRTTSSRSRVVFVNPVPLYGIDLALDIAAACPEIPFTFVESWPLTDNARSELQRRCHELGNCELLGYQDDPKKIYQDAKLLLMLCTVPSRPRVIPEAQANGIPVIAVDRPGHGEAIGDGGILVNPEATLEEWAAGIRTLWNDDVAYDEWSARALRHASRHDAAPAVVVQRFEKLVSTILRPNASSVQPPYAAPTPV